MSEADAIFGAFNKFSEQVHGIDLQRKHMQHLRERAQKNCGHCYWWMKSRDCPREKNVGGMSRGPSCSGLPCEKFRSTDDHAASVAAYAEALKG